MSQAYFFGDGSVIKWIDRETLSYEEDGFCVLIWVDFEPGFFARGRIIKASSLKAWKTYPAGSSYAIDKHKYEEILAKLGEYYRSQNIPYRIELSS